MFKCGDVVITVREISRGHEHHKVQYGYSVRLAGALIAKGNALNCPHDWTPAKVAAETVAWLIDAPAELRAELGWTFDPDELFGRLDSYDNGSETAYNVVEVR